MENPDVLGFLYALTVAAGGLFAYVKAGSIPSLVAGLTFGVICGAGAYQTSVQPNNTNIMLCGSGLLAIVMGYRFYNSHKFMPAGLVCALSLLMVVRSFYRMNA